MAMKMREELGRRKQGANQKTPPDRTQALHHTARAEGIEDLRSWGDEQQACHDAQQRSGESGSSGQINLFERRQESRAVDCWQRYRSMKSLSDLLQIRGFSCPQAFWKTRLSVKNMTAEA